MFVLTAAAILSLLLLASCFAKRADETVQTVPEPTTSVLTGISTTYPEPRVTTVEQPPVTTVTTESATETELTTEAATTTEPSNDGKPFTLAVAGDISFADNGYTYPNAMSMGYTIEDCFGASLLEKMRVADIFLVNNESCYSDRGSPLNGKLYTFRAATEHAELLHELGVDIACIANNHIWDYGSDAFLDTLETLENIGMPYIGGGHNEEEAYTAYYTEMNGVKLAFLAATRIERVFHERHEASGDDYGICCIFEPDRLVEAIKEADKNADYVIVYAHWGREYTETLEDVQREYAHAFIDAGADIVLGAHPHILQGMEFYDGKPIFYSIGNYWFNLKSLDTALLRIEFADGGYELYLDPARQSSGVTSEITDKNKRAAFFSHLEDISVNAAIGSDGRVYEKPN